MSNNQCIDWGHLESLSEAMVDQTIEIRGFPYQQADGEWIISPQPNLKSCCVGSPQQVYKQIYLSRSPPIPFAHAATFTGTFSLEPVYNDKQLVRLYTLKDVRWETQSTSSFFWPLLLLSLVCSIVGVRKWIKRSTSLKSDGNHGGAGQPGL